MSLLALTGLVNFITCVVLGCFVFFTNPKRTQNRTYLYLNASVALYSLGYFLWQLSSTAYVAFLWFKTLFVGVILINVVFLHFVFSFMNVYAKKRNELFFYYFVTTVFIILNVMSILYSGVEPRYNLGFWPNTLPLFHVFLIFWVYEGLYGSVLLIYGLKNSSGIKREQIKYVALAVIIALLGGATN
jgi:hypothetical protein